MTDHDSHTTQNSDRTSRRAFLRAATAAGAVGGVSGLAAGREVATSYKLGGKVAGWQGRAPASIEGKVNPTLNLQPGTKYEITWVNLDGLPHNLAVLAADGSVLKATNIVSEQGATQTLTFTATDEMDEYLCQVHPSSMHGQLSVGGEQTTRAAAQPAYDWMEATWDSYWYSLYNMSTTISLSGVGVVFPNTTKQKQMFKKRVQAMLKHSPLERPPIRNPNLNLAPYTEGDPHFTQRPVFPFNTDAERPHASTLAWDDSEMSHVVSPQSLGWTHLKGVTWAKNFQSHFEVLPKDVAPKFRSMVLGTMAQLAIKFALVDGNLRKGEDTMLLVSGYNPRNGAVVEPEPRPMEHAAMLWFLSDVTSLATGGWYGYANPEPLIPAKKIQQMTDGVAKATMKAFPPRRILETGTTRDLGVMLGAVGWYGTHAGSEQLQSRAAEYADALASAVEDNLAESGKLRRGSSNQAATQGAVGQGLLWTSQIPGVNYEGTARSVLTYMFDELWDDSAGTFADGTGDGTYTITAQDAGDITGGVNAADAVLGLDGVRDTYATFYDQTFNRGRLQRAERPPSRNPDAEYTLPLPPNAGGEHGQAAVYNTEIAYEVDADEWRVTNDRFTTPQALYLANQDIWIGQWAGDFFDGRGVPGTNDAPGES